MEENTVTISEKDFGLFMYAVLLLYRGKRINQIEKDSWQAFIIAWRKLILICQVMMLIIILRNSLV